MKKAKKKIKNESDFEDFADFVEIKVKGRDSFSVEFVRKENKGIYLLTTNDEEVLKVIRAESLTAAIRATVRDLEVRKILNKKSVFITTLQGEVYEIKKE